MIATPHKGPSWSSRLAVAVLLAALMGPLASAQPQAFGASPASISIPDAQSGQRYQHVIVVQNQLDTASTLSVERSGITAAWTTTDKGDSFTVAQRTNQAVTLFIQVPAGAAGPNLGELRFVTERKGDPSGSGAGIRYAVTIPINVTLAGGVRTAIDWSDASTQNTPHGKPAAAQVRATNVGNVRTTAVARATILGFDGEDALENATSQLALDPGASANLTFAFSQVLPLGQYRVLIESIDPPGFVRELTFKVHPQTSAVADAELHAIRHPARVLVGEPVRIEALVENLRGAPIQGALFLGEVTRGSRHVATLASEPQPLQVGERRNLTATWTPGEPGLYELRGHLVYDGYVTLERESQIEVLGKTMFPALGAWVFVVAALAAIAGVGYWLHRRSR